ncbi:MAG: DUF948 domain-containing protein [Planctomycetota bacterium]|nr:DUF948 domain-containing protein [Planctomycetota bacterium]
MPPEIYVAVLAACISIVTLTVLLIVGAVYLKGRVDSIEKSVSEVKGDISALIQESRGVVKEVQQLAARVAKPMDDVERITHLAREWSERADRMVDAVGTVAEPPLFLMSKNIKLAGRIGLAVFKSLIAPKR